MSPYVAPGHPWGGDPAHRAGRLERSDPPRAPGRRQFVTVIDGFTAFSFRMFIEEATDTGPDSSPALKA